MRCRRIASKRRLSADRCGYDPRGGAPMQVCRVSSRPRVRLVQGHVRPGTPRGFAPHAQLVMYRARLRVDTVAPVGWPRETVEGRARHMRIEPVSASTTTRCSRLSVCRLHGVRMECARALRDLRGYAARRLLMIGVPPWVLRFGLRRQRLQHPCWSIRPKRASISFQ